MTVNEIDSYNFHDAIIDKLEMSSQNDFFSEIILTLSFPNLERLKFVFRDCLCANLSLQMWIQGQDSIRNWSFDPAEKVKPLMESYKQTFKYISFNTNTTNSIIEVIYSSVDIQNAS